MTNLEYLEQMVKARTPGPWRSSDRDDCWRVKAPDLYTICKVTNSYATPTTDEPDAHFIALMGTIAEQLVAVVRAVKYWEDYYAIELAHYKNGETQVLCDAMAKLDAAIAAARNGMQDAK